MSTSESEHLNGLLKSLPTIIVLRERAADRSERVPALALPQALARPPVNGRKLVDPFGHRGDRLATVDEWAGQSLRQGQRRDPLAAVGRPLPEDNDRGQRFQ